VFMTDYCGLRYVFDQPKRNARQDRWMNLLGEFDFKIKHIKGKENRVVDTLSRTMKVIHLVAVSICETNFKERVKNAQETDAVFKTIKLYLEQEPIGMRYEGYQMLNDGLLNYKGRLYILNCDDLKRFMMDELQKTTYTSHPGYQKMITTTRKLLYWLGLKKDIVDYLVECLECDNVKE
jgi:hypothetical protein